MLIDGLDISQIGLTDLRSRLTIIPRRWLKGSDLILLISLPVIRGPHYPQWNFAIDFGCI